jgi:hypothetical protein
VTGYIWQVLPPPIKLFVQNPFVSTFSQSAVIIVGCRIGTGDGFHLTAGTMHITFQLELEQVIDYWTVFS